MALDRKFQVKGFFLVILAVVFLGGVDGFRTTVPLRSAIASSNLRRADTLLLHKRGRLINSSASAGVSPLSAWCSTMGCGPLSQKIAAWERWGQVNLCLVRKAWRGIPYACYENAIDSAT